MKSKLFGKGLVFGIMLLFVLAGAIPSTIGITNKKKTVRTLNNRGYIQDLIDNASPGDTIYVPSGTYYENIIINKSISLIGEDRDTTIIDGGGYGTVIGTSVDFVNISGFTITNGGSDIYDSGISVNSYSTITGNKILNNFMGISIWYPCFGNTISGNIISSNIDCGISIRDTCYNNITNNILINNTISFWGEYGSILNIISNNSFLNSGLDLDRKGFENTFLYNTVNGKPLVFLNETSDIIIENAGQIFLYYCNNITIENLNISNTFTGIFLYRTNNCSILGNNISSNNRDGMVIRASNNNYLLNNIITNNYGNAIDFSFCTVKNIATNNNIMNNIKGIVLYNKCKNILISNNTIFNNVYGIELTYWSNNNTITNNNISYNEHGVVIEYRCPSDNNIYHNNFINNTENANDTGNNIWDDGKYGNYWSDYEERYPDAKPKLFKTWMWNTPYDIPGGDNIDNCPLIKQWPNSASIDINRNKVVKRPILNFLEQHPILYQLLQRFL